MADKQSPDLLNRQISRTAQEVYDDMLAPLTEAKESIGALAVKVRELEGVINDTKADRQKRSVGVGRLSSVIQPPSEELKAMLAHVESLRAEFEQSKKDVDDHRDKVEDHQDKVEENWEKGQESWDKMTVSLGACEKALQSLSTISSTMSPRFDTLVGAAEGILGALNNTLRVEDAGLASVAGGILAEVKLANILLSQPMMRAAPSQGAEFSRAIEAFAKSMHPKDAYDRAQPAEKGGANKQAELDIDVHAELVDGAPQQFHRLMINMAQAALKKGSLYTHDLASESVLLEIMNDIKMLVQVQRLALQHSGAMTAVTMDMSPTDRTEQTRGVRDYDISLRSIERIRRIITEADPTFDNRLIIDQLGDRITEASTAAGGNRPQGGAAQEQRSLGALVGPAAQAEQAGAAPQRNLGALVGPTAQAEQGAAPQRSLGALVGPADTEQPAAQQRRGTPPQGDDVFMLRGLAMSVFRAIQSRTDTLGMSPEARNQMNQTIMGQADQGGISSRDLQRIEEVFRNFGILDDLEQRALRQIVTELNNAASAMAQAAHDPAAQGRFRQQYESAMNKLLDTSTGYHKRVNQELDRKAGKIRLFVRGLEEATSVLDNLSKLAGVFKPSAYGLGPELKIADPMKAVRESAKSGADWTKEISAAMYESMGAIGSNLDGMKAGGAMKGGGEIFRQLNPLGQRKRVDDTGPAQQKYLDGSLAGARDLDRLFRESGQQIVDIYRQTGALPDVFRKQFVGNLKRGIQDYTTLNRVTKLGLSLGKVIGANAEQTADEFADWNLHLTMSADELDTVARRTQIIGQITGVTGDNLLAAVKSAKQFAEQMRNAGTLTSEAAGRLIQLQASAKKMGVESQVNKMTEGLTSQVAFYTKISDQTRAFLVQSAQAGGVLKQLQTGTVLQDKDATGKLLQGMEGVLQRMTGMTLEAIENMDPKSIPFTTNLQISAVSGMELGEFQRSLRAMREGNMSAADKLAAIDRRLGGTLSTSDRAVLTAQREGVEALVGRERMQQVFARGDKIGSRIGTLQGGDREGQRQVITQELGGAEGVQQYLHAMVAELNQVASQTKLAGPSDEVRRDPYRMKLYREREQEAMQAKTTVTASATRLSRVAASAQTGNLDPQEFLDAMAQAKDAQGGLASAVEKMTQRDEFSRLEYLVNTENLEIQKSIESGIQSIAKSVGSDKMFNMEKAAAKIEGIIKVLGGIKFLIEAILAIMTARMITATVSALNPMKMFGRAGVNPMAGLASTGGVATTGGAAAGAAGAGGAAARVPLVQRLFGTWSGAAGAAAGEAGAAAAPGTGMLGLLRRGIGGYGAKTAAGTVEGSSGLLGGVRGAIGSFGARSAAGVVEGSSGLLGGLRSAGGVATNLFSGLGQVIVGGMKAAISPITSGWSAGTAMSSAGFSPVASTVGGVLRGILQPVVGPIGAVGKMIGMSGATASPYVGGVATSNMGRAGSWLGRTMGFINPAAAETAASATTGVTGFAKSATVTGGVGSTLKGAGTMTKALGKLGGPLALLDLVFGAVRGAGEAESVGRGQVEGGILGALTGDAKRGSSISSSLGIEKGSTADDMLGVGSSAVRGAMAGAAVGSIIPVVGTTVGAIVGGIAGAAAEIYKIFTDETSKLGAKLRELWGQLTGALSNAWTSVWSGIEKGFAPVMDTFSSIIGGITSGVADLMNTVGRLFGFISGDQNTNPFEQIWGGLLKGIEMIGTVVGWLMENVIGPFVNFLVTILGGAFTILIETLKFVVEIIVDILEPVVKVIRNAFMSLYSTIKSWAVWLAGLFSSDGDSNWARAMKGFKAAWEYIKLAFEMPTIRYAVRGFFNYLRTGWAHIADVAAMLVNGIYGAWVYIWNRIAKSWIGSAIGLSTIEDSEVMSTDHVKKNEDRIARQDLGDTLEATANNLKLVTNSFKTKNQEFDKPLNVNIDGMEDQGITNQFELMVKEFGGQVAVQTRELESLRSFAGRRLSGRERDEMAEAMMQHLEKRFESFKEADNVEGMLDTGKQMNTIRLALEQAKRQYGTLNDAQANLARGRKEQLQMEADEAAKGYISAKKQLELQAEISRLAEDTALTDIQRRKNLATYMTTENMGGGLTVDALVEALRRVSEKGLTPEDRKRNREMIVADLTQRRGYTRLEGDAKGASEKYVDDARSRWMLYAEAGSEFRGQTFSNLSERVHSPQIVELDKEGGKAIRAALANNEDFKKLDAGREAFWKLTKQQRDRIGNKRFDAAGNVEGDARFDTANNFTYTNDDFRKLIDFIKSVPATQRLADAVEAQTKEAKKAYEEAVNAGDMSGMVGRLDELVTLTRLQNQYFAQLSASMPGINRMIGEYASATKPADRQKAEVEFGAEFRKLGMNQMTPDIMAQELARMVGGTISQTQVIARSDVQEILKSNDRVQRLNEKIGELTKQLQNPNLAENDVGRLALQLGQLQMLRRGMSATIPDKEAERMTIGTSTLMPTVAGVTAPMQVSRAMGLLRPLIDKAGEVDAQGAATADAMAAQGKLEKEIAGLSKMYGDLSETLAGAKSFEAMQEQAQQMELIRILLTNIFKRQGSLQNPETMARAVTNSDLRAAVQQSIPRQEVPAVDVNDLRQQVTTQFMGMANARQYQQRMMADQTRLGDTVVEKAVAAIAAEPAKYSTGAQRRDLLATLSQQYAGQQQREQDLSEQNRTRDLQQHYMRQLEQQASPGTDMQKLAKMAQQMAAFQIKRERELLPQYVEQGAIPDQVVPVGELRGELARLAGAENVRLDDPAAREQRRIAAEMRMRWRGVEGMDEAKSVAAAKTFLEQTKDYTPTDPMERDRLLASALHGAGVTAAKVDETREVYRINNAVMTIQNATINGLSLQGMTVEAGGGTQIMTSTGVAPGLGLGGIREPVRTQQQQRASGGGGRGAPPPVRGGQPVGPVMQQGGTALGGVRGGGGGGFQMPQAPMGAPKGVSEMEAIRMINRIEDELEKPFDASTKDRLAPDGKPFSDRHLFMIARDVYNAIINKPNYTAKDFTDAANAAFQKYIGEGPKAEIPVTNLPRFNAPAPTSATPATPAGPTTPTPATPTPTTPTPTTPTPQTGTLPQLGGGNAGGGGEVKPATPAINLDERLWTSYTQGVRQDIDKLKEDKKPDQAANLENELKYRTRMRDSYKELGGAGFKQKFGFDYTEPTYTQSNGRTILAPDVANNQGLFGQRVFWEDGILSRVGNKTFSADDKILSQDDLNTLAMKNMARLGKGRDIDQYQRSYLNKADFATMPLEKLYTMLVYARASQKRMEDEISDVKVTDINRQEKLAAIRTKYALPFDLNAAMETFKTRSATERFDEKNADLLEDTRQFGGSLFPVVKQANTSRDDVEKNTLGGINNEIKSLTDLGENATPAQKNRLTQLQSKSATLTGLLNMAKARGIDDLSKIGLTGTRDVMAPEGTGHDFTADYTKLIQRGGVTLGLASGDGPDAKKVGFGNKLTDDEWTKLAVNDLLAKTAEGGGVGITEAQAAQLVKKFTDAGGKLSELYKLDSNNMLEYTGEAARNRAGVISFGNVTLGENAGGGGGGGGAAPARNPKGRGRPTAAPKDISTETPEVPAENQFINAEIPDAPEQQFNDDALLDDDDIEDIVTQSVDSSLQSQLAALLPLLLTMAAPPVVPLSEDNLFDEDDLKSFKELEKALETLSAAAAGAAEEISVPPRQLAEEISVPPTRLPDAGLRDADVRDMQWFGREPAEILSSLLAGQLPTKGEARFYDATGATIDPADLSEEKIREYGERALKTFAKHNQGILGQIDPSLIPDSLLPAAARQGIVPPSIDVDGLATLPTPDLQQQLADMPPTTLEWPKNAMDLPINVPQPRGLRRVADDAEVLPPPEVETDFSSLDGLAEWVERFLSEMPFGAEAANLLGLPASFVSEDGPGVTTANAPETVQASMARPDEFNEVVELLERQHATAETEMKKLEETVACLEEGNQYDRESVSELREVRKLLEELVAAMKPSAGRRQGSQPGMAPDRYITGGPPNYYEWQPNINSNPSQGGLLPTNV